MERIIVIRESKNQKKTTFKSNAETLGELKNELDELGIDYRDMTFYEGITKSEFTRDDAQLPHGVTYKGNVTNNLVFLLTQTNKKIQSGGMNRKEMYDFIKKNNLGNLIKEYYDKNYTNVSSEDLSNFIDMWQKDQNRKIDLESPTNNQQSNHKKYIGVNKECVKGQKENSNNQEICKLYTLTLTQKFKVLIEYLENHNPNFVDEINKIIDRNYNNFEDTFSDEEIDDLFK